MSTEKMKKVLLFLIPSVIFFYLGNRIAYAWRMSMQLTLFISNFSAAFSLSDGIISFHPTDIIVGLFCAAAIHVAVYIRRKNRKKFRSGVQYGSARWSTEKDIAPYMDAKNFSNNVILTATERLTMGKPSAPKYARNKNVEVIGGSGSGKTRFFLKPNLMQMHSSYVVTDPKGTVLVECGKMLQRGRPTGKKDADGQPIYEPYRIKVFNTVDFSKSMHYNPFAYISEKNREQDILKVVDVLIKNTTGSKNQNSGDFWEKAERLLYIAYIALIFAIFPKEEHNFATLIELINSSECREEDESFQNVVDLSFAALEQWLNQLDESGNDTVHDENMDELPEDDPEEEESPEEKINHKVLDDFYQCIHADMQLYSDEQRQRQIQISRFALRQYKAYKLAAGKTTKSILISCSARLSCFSIDKVLEITRYDELHLDELGDELSALFVIVPDTNATFNFLVAMMYSQMFDLLCYKADNNPDGSGKLKYHVRCLFDEFANIGQIPDFEKLIATIRSREISACIILQTKSQLKAIYKDNADTIEGNCDASLFLGGQEQTTLKELSDFLGKETIDDYDTSENRGQSPSYGMSYKKLGRELMTKDELAAMDGDRCILRIRGIRPFFSKKYDITKHPCYTQLKDYNPENLFDVGKYVQQVREHRLKLQKNDVVEVYKSTDTEV
ncbi:MAG: VirD4-like conjugal transfer protein, CD1115 family [Ruminococcus sp.]